MVFEKKQFMAYIRDLLERQRDACVDSLAYPIKEAGIGSEDYAFLRAHVRTTKLVEIE